MKQKTKSAKQSTVKAAKVDYGSERYEQTADGTITITLTGAIAANLHRAAATMNTVSWCDDDNTACDVLANFVFWQTMQNWDEDGPHNFYGGMAEEVEGIVYGIDTGAGDDEELDKKRKAELDAAFARAFKFSDDPRMAKLRHGAKSKA